MPENFEKTSRQFENPQEELEYLRAMVREKERAMETSPETSVEKPKADEIVSEQIREYRQAPEVGPKEPLKPSEEKGIIEGLRPEPHDKQMAELASLLEQKGVKNAFAVLDKVGDPHLEDDFHRFLVQYIKSGYQTELKEREPMHRALNMTLFEILLPEEHKEKGEQQRPLKEIISSMEQFYAGMLSIHDPKKWPNHFAIELAMPAVGEEFSFYVSVPTEKSELFEKQILSTFPNARIIEQKDDYNVFNENGVSVGSVASFSNKPIFPIKTYEDFDFDPINALLNAFSKVDKEGEGAAVQIIVSPSGGGEILRKFKHALEEIKKGKSIREAAKVPMSFGGEVFGTLKEVFGPNKKKPEAKDGAPPPRAEDVDQQAVENIQKKVSSPIVKVNIRLSASSRTESEANSILSDLESAFNQFENTIGNKFKFTRLSGGKLFQMLKDFSFRMFRDEDTLPMNLKELTSVMHLNTEAVKSAPQLKRAKAGSAPAPSGLPSEGTLLGINRHRNIDTPAKITDEDRLRHLYIIGQTGTGKSSLLKNLIIQDIEQGNGVCFIDPHGVDILDVLANVPKERYEDVIYFDPSFVDRPMGLNMLEYDSRFPEQKTFVVNELFSIFQKLYGSVPESMGPMFEQYFRNATMLVIEDPQSGNTLLDVSRVMANKEYRDLKLSRCKNPIVVQFWREVAEKAGGEAALANIVPYITSKFDVFLANDFMRPIVAQEKSAFNFREIIDNRKILLVNLAKGRLGDINSNLLGLIIVGKILMATLSRVDSFGKDIPPFYLYIDEFQNVTTDSIATILSEARKYKLSLTIAHQFIAQLEEEIRDAVFGNVGSMAIFRIGSDDAEYLEKQLAPTFSAKDLMNIDNYNAYLKMLVRGRPVSPFNIEIPMPSSGQREIVDKLKELSYLKYGRDRGEIEQGIADKHKA